MENPKKERYNAPERARKRRKAGKVETMKQRTIKRAIFGAYAYPVPRAARLERLSNRGQVKQAWNIYTTPGQYRENAEMLHKVKRNHGGKELPPIVYKWADMVNAIIMPAGAFRYTVDTPECLDTMTAADLIALARADMVEIDKTFLARGEKAPSAL